MKTILLVALLLMSSSVFAQDAVPQLSKIDPRILGLAVQALQSTIALREAQIKLLDEKLSEREAAWAEYSKPLWEPNK